VLKHGLDEARGGTLEDVAFFTLADCSVRSEICAAASDFRPGDEIA
jgi:hypothetical protein